MNRARLELAAKVLTEYTGDFDILDWEQCAVGILSKSEQFPFLEWDWAGRPVYYEGDVERYGWGAVVSCFSIDMDTAFKLFLYDHVVTKHGVIEAINHLLEKGYVDA